MSASLVIILAEDRLAQNLARRLFLRLGFSDHEIRPRPLPAGRGSGAAYVASKYLEEVSVWRRRAAGTVLLVHIDADQRTVEERRRELDSLLEQPLSPGDAVFHWIPRRNIETWLLWLLEPSAFDEGTDYKPEFRRRFGGSESATTISAAQRFFDLSRLGVTIPADCPPSLRLALQIPPPRRA